MMPDETSKEILEEFNQERNSLRRFLVGITATTFGVLVALHPNEFSCNACRWIYVISVLANAFSLVFLIGSLFGRYFMLKTKGSNQWEQEKSVFQGKDCEQKEFRHAKLFDKLSIAGLIFYLLAVVSAGIYIVVEVL